MLYIKLQSCECGAIQQVTAYEGKGENNAGETLDCALVYCEECARQTVICADISTAIYRWNNGKQLILPDEE